MGGLISRYAPSRPWARPRSSAGRAAGGGRGCVQSANLSRRCGTDGSCNSVSRMLTASSQRAGDSIGRTRTLLNHDGDQMWQRFCQAGNLSPQAGVCALGWDGRMTVAMHRKTGQLRPRKTRYPRLPAARGLVGDPDPAQAAFVAGADRSRLLGSMLAGSRRPRAAPFALLGEITREARGRASH